MANTPTLDSSEVTRSSCDGFALMKLPAELRNCIYGHYFADINEAQLFLNTAASPKTLWHKRLLPTKRTILQVLKAHLPLLFVNREVRAEAGQILYNQCLANVNFPMHASNLCVLRRLCH